MFERNAAESTLSYVHMTDISMFGCDSDKDWKSGPFADFATAKEYARRWMRSIVEEARQFCTDAEIVNGSWRIYGESARADGEGQYYRAADDIEWFVAHHATAEEQDFNAILRPDKKK